MRPPPFSAVRVAAWVGRKCPPLAECRCHQMSLPNAVTNRRATKSDTSGDRTQDLRAASATPHPLGQSVETARSEILYMRILLLSSMQMITIFTAKGHGFANRAPHRAKCPCRESVRTRQGIRWLLALR